MQTLLIAIGAAVAFVIAYHTYGRWLGSKIFRLSADHICPAHRLNDGTDYVPTHKSIVFGHHFTSIAGTGPIVGPAIAVMWGWLPALLWVVLGSIFIGAVHDFGALMVSLRNNGQTVGDIAGRVLNKRVRLLFLLVLFMALTIVLAIFGLVIASVFRQYPSAIFPCVVQIPIAVVIGLWLHRKGQGIFLPSIIALAVMYLTVIFGDQNTQVGIAFLDETVGGTLHAFNTWAAVWPSIVWVAVLLFYSYIASVLPVWTLLQPRDYINALQLISTLALIVIGLVAAAFIGGAPPVEGADRQPLEMVAPIVNWNPAGAPVMFPFLFITIACGAISGFHCLVSSGTSSKQLEKEPDARFVGYGSMLTEGFLATLVIIACAAGLGLGLNIGDRASPMGYPPEYERQINYILASEYIGPDKQLRRLEVSENTQTIQTITSTGPSREDDVYSEPVVPDRFTDGVVYGSLNQTEDGFEADIYLLGTSAFDTQYQSWKSAGGLADTVGAFVAGSANFLAAIYIPRGVAVALMGVLVASFAGTTLDTACRLQRYVVQELAATFAPRVSQSACPACGYDLSFNVSGKCPECGKPVSKASDHTSRDREGAGLSQANATPTGPLPDGRGSLKSNAKSIPPRTLWLGGAFNPFYWLTNKHFATIFAITIAMIIAGLPASTPPVGLWEIFVDGIPVNMYGLNLNPGQVHSTLDGFEGVWYWLRNYSGKGGLILWPLFGATNQLLGGLAFLVIAFYLWRRKIAVWFLILPLIFMLIMPAWAMIWQLFIGSEDHPAWLYADNKSWSLITIGIATLVLEAWMVIEAIVLWPTVRGVMEEQLPEV